MCKFHAHAIQASLCARGHSHTPDFNGLLACRAICRLLILRGANDKSGVAFMVDSPTEGLRQFQFTLSVAKARHPAPQRALWIL